jgi:uncharacterized protein (TIRG00374 family)
MNRNVWQRYRWPIHALITALFVALLFWRVDLIEAMPRLRHVHPGWAALGAALFAVSKLVQAGRWRLLLWHRRPLPFGALAGIYLVAALANTLVPLRGGDLLRVHLAARRFGIPRTELTATVFAVETPLNWATLIVTVALASLVADLKIISPATVVLLLAGLALGLPLALLAASIDRTRDFAEMPPLRWLPRPLRRALAERVPQFLHGMHALRSPGLGAALVALGMLTWLVEVGVYWSLAVAFGLPVRLLDALLAMVGANLVLSLPLTPAHVGPYHVVVTEILVLRAIERAAAGGFAVGAHLVLLLTTTALGILSTWALGLGPHDLTAPHREREAAEEPVASRSTRFQD